MTEAKYDPEQITKEVARKQGIDYNENKAYQNIAKNSKFAMDFNWHNNLVPDACVHMIATNEYGLEMGISQVARKTLENTLNHRYADSLEYDKEQKQDWFIGLIQELSRRDGLGAFGEIEAKKRLNAEFGDEDDEKKGIDLKTENTTYQVKTGENFNSSWSKKQADVLLWMETNGDGKIVEMHRK